MNPQQQIERLPLDWVGKMMLDSARIFATAGVTISESYMQRIIARQKTTESPI